MYHYVDHDISNCVLHVMDVASKLQNIELNEELIDADIENVQGVETDEDMLVVVVSTLVLRVNRVEEER